VQNATIKEFFDDLAKELPDHDFRLISGTQEFGPADNKILADLGISHLSRVIVMARFIGGSKLSM